MIIKMDEEKINKILNAIESVKENFKCIVCSEFYKDPVSLSTCFHMICSEHFNSLTNCPTCGVALEGCKVFNENQLNNTIDSAIKLGELFENLKPKENVSTDNNTTENTIATKNTKTKLNDKSSVPSKFNEECNNKRETSFSGPSRISKNDLLKLETLNDSNTADKTKINDHSSVHSKCNEKRNIKGETPLHVACRIGKLNLVKELLEKGANTNTKDNAGWTPLHEVVQNNRLDLVKVLLNCNTLIDVPGQSNETPLHEAVRYTLRDIGMELVKHGADLNARNIKGETPLQLATDDMKNILLEASEDIIQTQSINVNHMSSLHSEMDTENLKVYSISKFKTVKNKLKILTKNPNFHVETEWSGKVTHLIVDHDAGVCSRSLEVYQGIVNAVWILSFEWVIQSSVQDLQPLEEFEVVGVDSEFHTGPNTSRYNKYKLLPGLFNGCHFYLHKFNTKTEIFKDVFVTKDILSKLITDAGGVVLRRPPNPEAIPEAEQLVPYHAKRGGKLMNCSHYIIYEDTYEPRYNMSHLKALSVYWLFECIEKYELCEPS